MTDDDLTRFLDALPARPRLLGLGEPMHGEEEFLRARNEIFRRLVEREGYRSIAIESDALAGHAVDAFVAGGPGSIDDVMATGFSHGFGASAANRELVVWMRRTNQGRDPADRLRFDGFDAPLEMTSAASPRGSLTALHAYLAAHVDPAQLHGDAATIERLAGDDTRWTDFAAMMDASRSVGDSADARELRLLADDLAAVLGAETPGLIAASREAWEQANRYARTAIGLLRYHAILADPAPSRVARALGQRGAMMAANLRAIGEREARRGPTLVFAGISHVQKVPARWHLAGTDLRWSSAGAITAATAGDRYAVLAIALGSAPARGLGSPAPDTVEGVLAGYASGIHPADRVAEALRDRVVVPRTDTTTDQGYFPLRPGDLGGADGVLFLHEV